MIRKEKVLIVATIIVLMVMGACNQNTKKENTSKSSETLKPLGMDLDIKTLEEKAFSLVQESPEEAVSYFITLADKYGEAKDTIKYGLSLLNISNLFDEYLSDQQNALIYAQKALVHWTIQNDTLQMANLYKYLGLINGRLNNFKLGTDQIRTAQSMYAFMGSEPGAKVCDFNLASLLYNQGKYKESIELALSTESFWKDRNDDVRRFNIHTLILKNYLALSEELKAKDHMLINEAIIKRGNIPKHLVKEFKLVMAGK